MKICFIGFGRRAKTFMGEIGAIPEAEVVGIYDPFLSGKVPFRQYGDLRQMLIEAQPEVVIDASPPVNRFKNIELCNEFRVPIICEKPLLFTEAELESLKGISINIYPAYQLPFNPFFAKAFELAPRNKLTRIDLSQRVSLKPQGWKAEVKTALGGCLSDNGSHLINLAIHYFGLPERVFAELGHCDEGVESTADAILAYPDFTCRIHADWLSPVGKETKIILSGEEDIVLLETNEGTRLHVAKTKQDDGWTTLHESRLYEQKGLERNLTSNPYNKLAESPNLRMLSCFFDDIRTYRNQPSPYAVGILRNAFETSKVISALYQSAKEGKFILI